MKDHNEQLIRTLIEVDFSLEILKDYGDSESKLNYLYYLRDEINKRIKKENKARKA